jgi:hypothetical protein
MKTESREIHAEWLEYDYGDGLVYRIMSPVMIWANEKTHRILAWDCAWELPSPESVFCVIREKPKTYMTVPLSETKSGE